MKDRTNTVYTGRCVLLSDGKDSTEVNRVICADCLEILRDMPDNSVDLILTDPPYGIGESNEKNSSRGCLANTTDFGAYDWDKKKLERHYIDEMLRVSKNQVIFGGNYYANWLPPSSCWIVWDKVNGMTDFADVELAWASYDKAARIYKWKSQGMLQQDMKYKEVRIHPTQKPLPLFRWILKRFSSKDEIVLDPFCGSGTTGVAAVQCDQKFICIEKDPTMFRKAESRIRGEQSQEKLNKWVFQ